MAILQRIKSVLGDALTKKNSKNSRTPSPSSVDGATRASKPSEPEIKAGPSHESTITPVLDRIAAAGKAYGENKAGSREELVELGRTLVAELEITSEFLQRSFWAEPALIAILRIATDTNMLQHLVEAGNHGMTGSELAEKTGVEQSLLDRLLRHLFTMKILIHSDSRWHSTELGRSLAEGRYQDSIRFCYDVARPSFQEWPTFFKNTGYRNPLPGTIGPFQHAHKTDVALFEWLAQNPVHHACFGSFMSAYRAGKPNWFDPGFYPVAERLITGFDANVSDVLLVDVGGGRGHDMRMFQSAHASHPGKIVLQDLPDVLDSIEDKDEQKFEARAHDFFTAQPVTARAYSLHSILHDWSDEDGLRILENLKPALKAGYSKVLLNEIVLSEEQPTLAATNMDLMMLAHFAVRERTERDWRAILEKAGFKVTRIYTYPGVAESLIEAELA